jgi:hypothetical protein
VEALIDALDGVTGQAEIEVDPTALVCALEAVQVRVQAIDLPYVAYAAALATLEPIDAWTIVEGARLAAILQRCIAVVGGSAVTTATLTVSSTAVDVAAESIAGRSDGYVPASGQGETRSLPVNARQAVEALEACGDGDVRVAVRGKDGKPLQALDIRPVARPDALQCLIMRMA